MSVSEITNTLKLDYVIGYNDDDIERKCIELLENKCCSDGFVIPGTVEILGRSFPVNMVGNGKMVVYVNYKCKVAGFEKNDIVEVKVTKVTKGVGAMGSVYVMNKEIGKVIIPDDIQMVGKKATENDNVMVKILTSTYGYGWDMYRGVGLIV